MKMEFIDWGKNLEVAGVNRSISQDHSTQGYDGSLSTTQRARAEISNKDHTTWDSELNTETSSSRSNTPRPYQRSGTTKDEEHESRANKLVEDLQAKLKAIPELQSSEDGTDSRVMDYLILTISRLQVETQLLKERLEEVESDQDEETPSSDADLGSRGQEMQSSGTPDFETFHLVQYTDENGMQIESFYRDAPMMFKGDTKHDQPRGTIEVEPAEHYLEKNPSVAFVLLHVYFCDPFSVRNTQLKAGYMGGVLTKDIAYTERKSINIVLGPSADRALKAIISSHPAQFPGVQSNFVLARHQQPFHIFYLYNKTLLRLNEASNIDELAKRNLNILCKWMEDECRESWNEADEMFARGKVNSEHLVKLFRPGELILHPNPDQEWLIQASMVRPFPHEGNGYLAYHKWAFNGDFLRYGKSLLLHLPQLMGDSELTLEDDNQLVDITSLSIYPLRFAPRELTMKLIARGHKLWRLRTKTLVCYKDPRDEEENQAERRSMIDYAMFSRLHPDNDIFKITGVRDKSLLKRTLPPDDRLLSCLPPTVHGFDFFTNSWKILRVERITDVTWNKTAFKQLVVPEETKELIQAAVTIHGQRSSAALDIIEGKGQGLVILLHGGPGTGKTLTAESIAEIQERPLYRVTFGDIGTEPAEIEQYLGQILDIGKAWGCVVVLDEADVFLEERSFTDQKRNAIIAIFLRKLEYYDGILILTTNRVGSFDEAFKSRVQLALGYPNLNEEDRLKIWRNFVHMLPRTGDLFDLQDLEMNLPRLARIKMNGREIRNVVTMGRHLAKFRHEILRYQHMQDATRSVQKFNDYLTDVKGLHDDVWAREDKLR